MGINKDAVIKFWQELSPFRKRTFTLAAILVFVMVLGTIGYMNRSKGDTSATRFHSTDKKVEVNLEPGLLEKSNYREQESQSRARDEKMKLLEKEIEDLKKGKAAAPATPADKFPAAGLPPLPGQKGKNPGPLEKAASSAPTGTVGSEKEIAGAKFPTPPLPLAGNKPTANAAAASSGNFGGTLMGEIEIVSNPNAKSALAAGGAADKKKVNDKEKIYLPPSFMEASLLSGLDAPTAAQAKGNPVPVLIRVKTVAVLPNSVKANLKGCFVIADGLGNLADERAHLRLVSLTCLAKNGNAVIDQKIKGFVVDGDGKIGLKGHVVAKMGSLLARDMIAGFFGGLGQAMTTASTVTGVSPLGTTQTVDSSQLGRIAAGQAVATAASDLQKFYLRLAENTLPVIEIGAARDITLVISEGIDLNIKEMCNRSNTLEGKCSE